MAFDRSKFKKASLGQIDEVAKKAEQTMYSNNKEYVQYVSVLEGKNIFRVLPAIKDITYAAVKTSKLQCEVTTFDQNQEPTTEVKSKNVFCADVHGTNLLKGKDPISTYCKYVYKKAEEEIQDNEEKKKYLAALTGYRGKKGFVFGINPTLNYVCYVWMGGKDIRKLQLRPAWLKRIKEISIELSEDDVMSLDVFSGVDDGYPLCITMTEDDKKKKTYSVSAVTPKRGQSWDDFFEENAIPDDVLQELVKLQSLEELYVNCYSRKDFDLAIDGLHRLDEEEKYGIFQDDAFLDEIEQMSKMIPEEDEEEDDNMAVKEKQLSKKRTPSKQEEDDEEEKPIINKKNKEKKYPSLREMKAFLDDYIETEYEGTEELPDLSLAEIREWYDLAQKDKPLPFEKYKEEEDEEEDDDTENSSSNEEDEEENPVTEAAQLASSRDRIRSLREKYKK